ncbi:MAG TPA: ROK family transcriptional regulator [Firmicutes bacterium]|nr:ROK family transcriptional regulator [Bacillota bacterium]
MPTPYTEGNGLPADASFFSERRKSAAGPSLVLEAIRTYGALSRSDLAEITGLSRAAITKITSAMIAEKMLRETEQTDTGTSGRPVQPLEINDSYAYAAGIQMRDEYLEFVVIGFAGILRSQHTIDFEHTAHPDEVLPEIKEGLATVTRKAGLEVTDLVGVGLALPGMIDHQAGMVKFLPGYEAWRNYPIGPKLAGLLNIPVTVHWRVNAAAIAEMWWGQGKLARNFVYINIDNGVGMATIVDKRLWFGHEYAAGMLGHMPVPGCSRRCICGNRGCLMTLVSIPAHIHLVEEAYKEGVGSVLTRPLRVTEPHQITFTNLVAAAEAGDRLACNIFAEVAENLAVAIATVVHLLNPQLIVLGGQIVEASHLIADSLKKHVEDHLLGPEYQTVNIAFSELVPSAATVGGATLALDLRHDKFNE